MNQPIKVSEELTLELNKKYKAVRATYYYRGGVWLPRGSKFVFESVATGAEKLVTPGDSWLTKLVKVDD